MIKAVVIGGDKRQLYLAGALERAGIEVTLGALVRRAGEKSAENTQGYSALPTEKIKECDMLILPTPVSRDGETLFAPLTDDNIKLSDIFAAAKGKRVFGGAAGEKVKAAADIFGIKIEDIMEMERIAAALAVATAEGAIAIAVENHEGTLFASECLITGYGRIGKLLAVRLKALGANVTVTARKEADFAAAETAGFDVVHTENFTEAVKKAASGERCPWPAYDRMLHDPIENAVTVDGDIVLLEGNYLLLDKDGWRDLKAFADYTVSVRADESILRARLIDRRIKTKVDRERAVRFVDFSDMPNVRLCLEKTLPADLRLLIGPDGDYTVEL